MKKLFLFISFLISLASFGQIYSINPRTDSAIDVLQRTVPLQPVHDTVKIIAVVHDTITVVNIITNIIHDTITIIKDTCIIQPVNQPPVSNAGPNKIITLPTNIISATGSGTDADGTIAGYIWTSVSGPNIPSIIASTSPTATFSNLIQGTYVFRLTVVDNNGASANDTMSVVVLPQPVTGYTLIYSNPVDRKIGLSADGKNNLGDLDPFSHGQYGNGYIDLNSYLIGPGSFHSRPSDVSSGIRSEIQYESGQTPLEGALEYDVLYNVIIPNNGHSLQWHPSTSGGSASPGLWFSSGKFLWNNWINGVNQGHSTGVTIQKGHWYHMRMEYKFGSNGYFRHYIDGALVCSWTGQVGDGSTPYLKVGYNGWDSNSTSSDIQYDNIQVLKKQ